jgi:hypothetical protein
MQEHAGLSAVRTSRHLPLISSYRVAARNLIKILNASACFQNGSRSLFTRSTPFAKAECEQKLTVERHKGGELRLPDPVSKADCQALPESGEKDGDYAGMMHCTRHNETNASLQPRRLHALLISISTSQ